MQGKKPAERRRGSRLHVGIDSVVLRYRKTGEVKANPSTPLGAWKETLCKDINMAGLRFLAGERLNAGTLLDLDIYLKSKEETPITVGGKVVWQREDVKGKKFETGVSLNKVNEADRERFTDFVFSTLHQMFKR